MERGTRGVLNAVLGPRTAALRETDVVFRMPVPGRDHGYMSLPSRRQVSVDHRNNLVAVGNRQTAARTEIVLHVYYDQRITWMECPLRHEYLLRR
jgi:hypothetical protein